VSRAINGYEQRAREPRELSQCLTGSRPLDAAEPIATVLRRHGRLLWLGATLDR
jgi:hypothetical protein